MVIDFRQTDLTGKRAQAALESVGLVANKISCRTIPAPPSIPAVYD
jgi:glycine/serine hydroxymethyltransferase